MCNGSPSSREGGKISLDFLKYNTYLVLVGISTFFSFSVSFKRAPLYLYNVLWGICSLRLAVWARGKEFVSLLTLYINTNQNKTLFPLLYSTTMEYCCTLCEQNHSFSLELRGF